MSNHLSSWRRSIHEVGLPTRGDYFFHGAYEAVSQTVTKNGTDKRPPGEVWSLVLGGSEMQVKIISNGNFAVWFRILLWTAGIAIAVGSYFILTGLFMFVGAVIGMLVLAAGTYSEHANLLHLKPFDNSYKKARASYEVEDDEQDKST